MDADGLYGLPLNEFTPARDDLAKRLRADGRADEAAHVKALKKPSPPAWAVNQLARNERKRVKQLLQAGERLRKAHASLGPRTGREKLQAAAEKERALVADLVERAKPLLGKPSAANLERVRNTLHAAAIDEALRAELAAGCVVRDREAVGLGPLGLAAGAVKAGKEDKAAAAKRRGLREARARSERAAKQLTAAEAALERARTDAEEAERALRDRTRARDQARREAEEADADLDLLSG